ncbi:uncharacterized protein BYT42DRAFT_590169 [Radiomyces spectabilis]|uniref:uncharacterized protein n=1 Tax=Radiomyces spectabilis TaxID=64574 RepID=UPI00221FCF7B|nr:uncharacterized protein BYT42DRAFT_590169 [Radiomyces spectabilis]KAI8364727.1 hypothetical protein BYT42DRAFT_590169 [Radiomyces spectabilis]
MIISILSFLLIQDTYFGHPIFPMFNMGFSPVFFLSLFDSHDKVTHSQKRTSFPSKRSLSLLPARSAARPSPQKKKDMQ